MKIALVQLGKIGDMILLGAVYDAVLQKYPVCEITVIAGRRNAFIAKADKRVARVIVYEKSPSKLVRFIIELRKYKFDYFIDAKDHYSFESRITAKIARAGVKIGYNAPQKKSVYDLSVKSDNENENLHFIDRVFAALSLAGIEKPKQKPFPLISINSDSKSLVQKYIIDNKLGKYTVINISASHEERMLNSDFWIKLVNSLEKEEKFVFISAPEHSQMAIETASKCNSLFYSSKSIFDAAALIEQAALVITPDTAIVHIASGLNKPLIALFTGLSSNLNKFYPMSDKFKIVRSAVGDNTLKSISIDEIKSAYIKMR